MAANIKTYITLDGDVLDLSTLEGRSREFLARAIAGYESGADWRAFAGMVYGPGNPVLDPGARISRATQAHPLYRALHDLADRLAIAQGGVAPAAGDDIQINPFGDALVSVADAAAAKGVTPKAVYLAIERGDLVGLHDGRTVVSATSLRGWHPQAVRQQAGLRRASPHLNLPSR